MLRPVPEPSPQELHVHVTRRSPPCAQAGALELNGISRVSVEAHYRLYQGYVAKRNEIVGLLAQADAAAANQVYSEYRALKLDLTFALGAIKNHEVYFEHLGGAGGDPTGPIGS